MKIAEYIKVFGEEETLRTLGLDKLAQAYRRAKSNKTKAGKKKLAEIQAKIEEMKPKEMGDFIESQA